MCRPAAKRTRDNVFSSSITHALEDYEMLLQIMLHTNYAGKNSCRKILTTATKSTAAMVYSGGLFAKVIILWPACITDPCLRDFVQIFFVNDSC